MLSQQREYVLRTSEERGVRLVRMWFTDVLGNLKSFAISPAELEGALREIQKINRNTTVLVRADEDSQFKKVTEVWDLCRQLGLNQVKMQARK